MNIRNFIMGDLIHLQPEKVLYLQQKQQILHFKKHLKTLSEERLIQQAQTIINELGVDKLNKAIVKAMALMDEMSTRISNDSPPFQYQLTLLKNELLHKGPLE